MLFNSFEFLLFLPIVFLLYWFVFQKNLKLQNVFILLASYVFYGWWDWRFLALIVASSAVDYWCGIQLVVNSKQSAVDPANRILSTANSKNLFKNRKFYLWISLAFNLGLLGFFKYFNFFIESATDIINLLGFQAHSSTLSLILPVGISFYTFQTMSYTLDVYRGKMEATKDPIAFFSYVAFFPQLVAGPIERASHLLPQFLKKREFEYQQGSDGMKLILWGLFKKMVIADNCALVVNPIFENYQTASGIELAMGAILFAFQIYGDFSGYSDIAIGVAKLFGFELMTNFRTPYFSRNIAEFWRRWHISLSTWFRDYVYIPLGGSRVSRAKAIRNIFIVFLVSGFWHGANWTFLVWGGIHASLFVPVFLIGKNRVNLEEGKHLFPGIKEFLKICLTFSLVSVSWIFFRSDSISIAWEYLTGLIHNPFLSQNFSWFGYDLRIALILFVALEWIGKHQMNWLFTIERTSIRYSAYLLVSVLLVYWGVFGEAKEFIYFQF